MVDHSPLEARHRALGAAMIDFAGWTMPVRYSSDLAEHTAVRTEAGLFDLSHMGEILITGLQASEALDFALVGRMSAIPSGKAKYTMICAEDGGVIDDLIVYRHDQDRYLVVANAGNAAVVVGEIRDRCRGFDCEISDTSRDTALIAVQGPRAVEVVSRLVDSGHVDPVLGLVYYSSTAASVAGLDVLVARTGYTGEDGFEFFVDADRAENLWDRALEFGQADGLVPCGLASRDTLRLEAGMPLYGHELGLDRSPFEAGLGRVVHFGDPGNPREDFVGRSALLAREARVSKWRQQPETAPEEARVLVGLVGQGKRAARAGYRISKGTESIGVVTSGAPSPTLGHPIAMAYVHPRFSGPGTEVEVDVRGRGEALTVSALPFYSRSK